jgi:hypothetical protein
VLFGRTKPCSHPQMRPESNRRMPVHPHKSKINVGFVPAVETHNHLRSVFDEMCIRALHTNVSSNPPQSGCFNYTQIILTCKVYPNL